jgi:hypothetical protein
MERKYFTDNYYELSQKRTTQTRGVIPGTLLYKLIRVTKLRYAMHVDNDFQCLGHPDTNTRQQRVTQVAYIRTA